MRKKAHYLTKYSTETKITLLHCVSNYPCSDSSLNLNNITTLKNTFKLPVGFSDKSNNKLEVIPQSTSKTKINFSSKKNIISFVGKLNDSKGYDIFGKTILRILDEFKNWNAIVVGDEPRQKHFFFHKRLSDFIFIVFFFYYFPSSSIQN